MPDHLPEYLAEVAGTTLMMLIGVGAIALMWASMSPVPGWIESPDLRRLLTGMMFAGGATLVVVSPLGQRSGGHLNPAVTLAFWLKGNTLPLHFLELWLQPFRGRDGGAARGRACGPCLCDRKRRTGGPQARGGRRRARSRHVGAGRVGGRDGAAAGAAAFGDGGGRDSELRLVTPENFAHVIAEHPEQTLKLLKQLSERLHEAGRKLVL